MGSNHTPIRVRSEPSSALGERSEACPAPVRIPDPVSTPRSRVRANCPHVLRESKVTVKIPRPLYRKIQLVVEGSGFSSPTDFIVYVLRDLMGEASAPSDTGPDGAKREFSNAELEDLKRKLKKLGYL